jgi:hypothetical protein
LGVTIAALDAKLVGISVHQLMQGVWIYALR